MERRYYRVRLSVSGAGTSENATVQLPTASQSANQVWLLASFTFGKASGSAASWTPRLMQTSTASDSSIEERFVYASGSASINDVFAQPMPSLADSDATLYFKPGFNTGSDNNYGAEVWFVRAKGGAAG